jgi:hypothetical protein
MLDLYCWVALLSDICLNGTAISESVSSVKESLNQLEVLIEKAKKKLGRLAADLTTDYTEIFNCEDILGSLMLRLQLERRRLLSVCVELATQKLLAHADEVRSETTKMGVEEVRHVALFCKKVLRAMQTELPTQLPEVDLVAFSHLKTASVQLLRLIVVKVLANSTEQLKHKRGDGGLPGGKVMKTTDSGVTCYE